MGVSLESISSGTKIFAKGICFGPRNYLSKNAIGVAKVAATPKSPAVLCKVAKVAIKATASSEANFVYLHPKEVCPKLVM
jgi:hypothetical protein